MSISAKFASLFFNLLPARAEQSSATRLGLQRLLLLRSFVTLASLLGLFIFHSVSSLDIPFTFITLLIGAIVVTVIFGYWRLTKSWIVSNIELLCHLLVDVLFLIFLLANTGGVSNPLISYLLVLLAVSATLLPRPLVFSFAVGTVLLYSSFMLADLTAEHDMSMGSMNDETTFQLHLVGMWVIFLVSALLITVFITRMAEAIRDRELNLAKAREAEMSNEQLVAIGTLAAGTAHALGTPLSTMAVLLAELDQMDTASMAPGRIKEDISLLRQQVTRCKHSLNQLIRYYNKDTPEQDARVRLSEFINDIRDYIANIHPTAAITFTTECKNDPFLAANLSFRHAVINIIENAIRAATSRVDVTSKISESNAKQLEISIKDDGPGIPAEVMERVGQPFISMSKEHMGLGIYLANAAVQRLGGRVEMFNIKDSGALTTIRIPLPDQMQD